MVLTMLTNVQCNESGHEYGQPIHYRVQARRRDEHIDSKHRLHPMHLVVQGGERLLLSNIRFIEGVALYPAACEQGVHDDAT